MIPRNERLLPRARQHEPRFVDVPLPSCIARGVHPRLPEARRPQRRVHVGRNDDAPGLIDEPNGRLGAPRPRAPQRRRRRTPTRAARSSAPRSQQPPEIADPRRDAIDAWPARLLGRVRSAPVTRSRIASVAVFELPERGLRTDHLAPSPWALLLPRHPTRTNLTCRPFPHQSAPPRESLDPKSAGAPRRRPDSLRPVRRAVQRPRSRPRNAGSRRHGSGARLRARPSHRHNPNGRHGTPHRAPRQTRWYKRT